VINTWTNGKQRIISPVRPGKDFYPEVEAGRVKSKFYYTPYIRGSKAWVEAANAALAQLAADYFQRPQRW